MRVDRRRCLPRKCLRTPTTCYETTICIFFRSFIAKSQRQLRHQGRKVSYGDIDILVSLPKSISTSTESIAKMLGAKRTISIFGSPTTSFALPYPSVPNQYVQLDVHLSPPEVFHWQLFHQSHADLWSLLGTTIRSVGLTANNNGLHVRIQKIEDFNRKGALLFLTCDSNAVLEFLGLDADT